MKNEFYYEVKGDDNSVSVIRGREKFYRFNKCNPTSFSKSIKNLAIEIYKDEEIMNNFEFSKLNRDSKFVKASKRIWKDLGIELRDVQYFKRPLSEEEFNKMTVGEFYSNIAYGSPTKIPIEYTDDALLARSMGMLLDLKKYNTIIFHKIHLPKVNKYANSCIYAHEITHTVLDTAGGGVNKITNRETIPILIELLFGNKLDEKGSVTDELLRHRIAYLAGAIAELINRKDINFEKRIKLETYVKSIIQGIALYNKYMDGNNAVKKEMIEGINDIIKGEIITEDLLDYYDSKYTKVDHDVKTLRKQMTTSK